MPNKIKDFVKGLGDPIADRTSWYSKKPGGTSTQTQKVVEVSPTHYELRQANVNKLTCGAMITIGTAFFTLEAYFLWNGEWSVLFLIVGMAFTVPGLIIWYAYSRVRVFDTEAGLSWRGLQPLDAVEISNRKDCVILSEVHALQIISELVSIPSGGPGAGTNDSSQGSKFSSFELNLVLKDGSRVNILDHGYDLPLREDARKLGNLLSVPV